jgi:hypothetical protein
MLCGRPIFAFKAEAPSPENQLRRFPQKPLPDIPALPLQGSKSKIKSAKLSSGIEVVE